MRTVIQRVTRACVRVDGQVVGEIGHGLLVLLGLGQTDTPAARDWMIEKILKLRIFPDAAGKMNRSVTDIAGGILVVSQFTVYGEVQKGTRPSFTGAMAPAEAEPFYREFLEKLRAATRLPVAAGRFAARMQVELVNDGPVTIVLDSPATFAGQTCGNPTKNIPSQS
jgi:D-tyrosyl-tRNA(Tyr) deacylase